MFISGKSEKRNFYVRTYKWYMDRSTEGQGLIEDARKSWPEGIPLSESAMKSPSEDIPLSEDATKSEGVE